MTTNLSRTQMDREQMRQVLKGLDFWAHEHSTGWAVRSGPSCDTTPFDGLYLNEYRRRAYFTLRPIKGNIQWPKGRRPDPDLWVELDHSAVRSLHRRDGRRNYAPRDGLECTAVRQFLS